MQRLLFLAHRIPYPPNKGDKIRSFHLLRGLAQHYRVSLGAFVDDPDDWRHAEALGRWCAELKLLPLRRRWLRYGGALLQGAPLSIARYRDPEMGRWVATQWQHPDCRRGLLFSGAMGVYLGRMAGAGRRVLDLVDVDSEKWRELAALRSGITGWLYRREATRLADMEATWAAACAATTLVSEPEAALLLARHPRLKGRVHALANGVDLDYFDAAAGTHANPYAVAASIVFTGAMDYPPNVDAVVWYATEVMPRVRHAVPSAQFHVVGARPVRRVRQLAALAGVNVTGAVRDVRPYLAHAAVAVAPLRVARGVQKKVLEALARNCPLLASSAAMTGIRLPTEAHGWIADDAAVMASQTVERLRHPRRLGDEQGRGWVARHFDWGRSLARVVDLLEGREAVTEDVA